MTARAAIAWGAGQPRAIEELAVQGREAEAELLCTGTAAGPGISTRGLQLERIALYWNREPIPRGKYWRENPLGQRKLGQREQSVFGQPEYALVQRFHETTPIERSDSGVAARPDRDCFVAPRAARGARAPNKKPPCTPAGCAVRRRDRDRHVTRRAPRRVPRDDGIPSEVSLSAGRPTGRWETRNDGAGGGVAWGRFKGETEAGRIRRPRQGKRAIDKFVSKVLPPDRIGDAVRRKHEGKVVRPGIRYGDGAAA